MMIYSDESPEGVNFRLLLPCILGTLVDWGQVSWAADLLQSICLVAGPPGAPDFSAAGWCLYNSVGFGRADWAASICMQLRQQPAQPWFSEQRLLDSVVEWGGQGTAQEIHNCLASF